MNHEPEPVIVCWGRSLKDQYPVEEYRQSLIRAFRDKKADFIVLDSFMTGQRFLAASVAWALDEGLLHNDQNHSGDEQNGVVSSFRLTEKGKKEILGG